MQKMVAQEINECFKQPFWSFVELSTEYAIFPLLTELMHLPQTSDVAEALEYLSLRQPFVFILDTDHQVEALEHALLQNFNAPVIVLATKAWYLHAKVWNQDFLKENDQVRVNWISA